ncbi:MAG: SMP-30/gluconolactonase/LRE family protein [Thermoprotei archaeon]
MRVEVLVNHSFRLAESPLLDWESGDLYWVDIEGNAIYRLSSGREEKLLSVRTPTTLAFSVDRELVYTSFRSVVYEGRTWSLDEEGVRFNDGKCSPEGEFWVGTMDLEERRPIGKLYSFDGRKFRELVKGLTVSNGMDWLDDEFYLIDSPRRTILVFSYPSMKLKRTIDTSLIPGVPDGMTIDEQGRLWVAHYGGGLISVWNGGKLEMSIEIPVKLVTSVALGVNEAFVTTSGRDGVGGQVYRIEAEVRGRKPFTCDFSKS